MKSGPRRAHFACGVKDFLHSSRARSDSPSYGSNPGVSLFVDRGQIGLKRLDTGFITFHKAD